MQDKFEFDRIPWEINEKIADFSSAAILENLTNLETKSKQITSPVRLFQSKLTTRLQPFLRYVVEGEHGKVRAMLEKDISLLFVRGEVNDGPHRIFDKISAFEYALWALDKHMWAMMIECIPRNEEGRKVFAHLIAQYNKVNTDGVTYKLDGKTITEKHFDFQNTLIKELQTQVDSINAPGVKNWDAIDNQWREGVGGAQKRLPRHIVDEYCSDEPFYPVPKFTSQPKSSKKFYNWTTDKNEDWFSVDSKLGVEFAICRGNGRAMGVAMGEAREQDLDALKALCEVRTMDFIDLKSQLEKQASLDNHHQVVPMTACR